MTWETINGFTRPQQKIFLSRARFRVVVAGRRFGKTVLGANELLYEAQRSIGREVWYIAPTYKMAKDLIWDSLKDSILPSNIESKHETDLTIKLRGYKSRICLKGADNPDSLRGKGINHAIFDEFANIDPDTWFKVIYPALTDKRGSAMFIGTPAGYNWAYDLSVHAQNAKDWEYFQYTTAEGGNVSEEELEYARNTLSPKHYAQEFEASFESLANRVYSYFDRRKNVDRGVEDIGGTLHIGMDFNVDPMSCNLSVKAGDQLHTFDEINIPNGNTDEMCQEIRKRYSTDRHIIVHPDASGKSRKTSAPVGQTDFTIIRGHGMEVWASNSNPSVVDRINEVNAMMTNAKKVKRSFIHPRCKQLIKGFDGLTYKEGTSIPDKSLGLDHQPDAYGYKVHNLFPIVKPELTRAKILGL